MSAEIEQRTLFDLPLQLSGANSGGTTGRRTLDAFILLTPGVVGNQFSKSINGSQNLSTDTIIDGISWQINIVPGLIGTFGPPYESVEEFKVQTSNFPAEYSRGFGVTNFTMKSGTNQFHGNAFNFLRNDALEATPFFGNATGGKGHRAAERMGRHPGRTHYQGQDLLLLRLYRLQAARGRGAGQHRHAAHRRR